MTALRRRFWFSITLPLLAGAPVFAQVRPQRDWLQVQSPHFLVLGDAGARELRRTAERLEQLHEAMAVLSPRVAPATDDTTVVVFRDEASFRAVSPTYQGRTRELGGYFSPGPMNYVALLAGPESTQRVVYHEYAHLRLEGLYGSLPLWLNEGLAEYYSTFDVVDGGRTVQLGRIVEQHLLTIRQRFLPLATLGAVGHQSPHYNQADKTSLFYAESWALIHYLALGREETYRTRLGGFLDAIAAGMPLADAALARLDLTVDTLENELRAYARGRIFSFTRISMPQRLAAIQTVTAVPVTEADAHVVLGALLIRMQNASAAIEHLEHALTVAPTHALALGLLAEERAKAGLSDDVRALVERAGASPSATWLSEYHRVLALDREELSPGDAKHMEAALRRAVELNPQSADARARLAFSLGRGGDDLPTARQMIEEAIRLKPAREEYRLTLASVLLRQHENRAARDLLGPLMVRGQNHAIREAARALMGDAARMAVAQEREQQALEAAQQLIADAPLSAVGEPQPVPPDEPPSSPPSPDAALIPVLRPLGDGEHRVAGTLTRIDCSDARVTVSATIAAGTLRLQADALDQIEFISHRGDLEDVISCGDQTRTPVLITFRTGTTTGAPGVIVAVEFVPPGFKLPG